MSVIEDFCSHVKDGFWQGRELESVGDTRKGCGRRGGGVTGMGLDITIEEGGSQAPGMKQLRMKQL